MGVERVQGDPAPTNPPLRTTRQHGVHHKNPFRAFTSREEANRLENLITLCPSCHKKVEANVRMRSGLAGVAYVFGNLAPLFLMCDAGDLGTHIEPVENKVFGQPTIVLYDSVPAGIGFSEKLFEMHDDLIARAYELVSECACEDGCPSCVGPGGENGVWGKAGSAGYVEGIDKNFVKAALPLSADHFQYVSDCTRCGGNAGGLFTYQYRDLLHRNRGHF